MNIYRIYRVKVAVYRAVVTDSSKLNSSSCPQNLDFAGEGQKTEGELQNNLPETVHVV